MATQNAEAIPIYLSVIHLQERCKTTGNTSLYL